MRLREAVKVTMSVGYLPHHLPQWHPDSLPTDIQETRSTSLEWESMTTPTEPSGELASGEYV